MAYLLWAIALYPVVACLTAWGGVLWFTGRIDLRIRPALARITIGRAVIHAGIRILPRGATRTELTRLLELWAEHVSKQLEAKTR